MDLTEIDLTSLRVKSESLSKRDKLVISQVLDAQKVIDDLLLVWHCIALHSTEFHRGDIDK